MSDNIHFHLTSNVWLLTWSDWNWEDFDECVKNTRQGIPYTTAWRCHTTQARPGDTFFLVRQGRGVRGIMAIGTIGSYRFYDSEDGKARVNVIFNYIIDCSKENILTTESLENDCPNQMWSPRGSGISIKSEYHSYLEDRWNSLIESGSIANFHSDTLLTKSIEQEEQLEKDIALSVLEGSDRIALVKQRINQGAFRERLLIKYKNGCFICGAGVHLPSVLVASHIKPWVELNSEFATIEFELGKKDLPVGIITNGDSFYILTD